MAEYGLMYGLLLTVPSRYFWSSLFFYFIFFGCFCVFFGRFSVLSSPYVYTCTDNLHRYSIHTLYLKNPHFFLN